MGSFLLLLAVGWAKARSAVPTVGPRIASRMVGTLRFAHPTNLVSLRRLALSARQHRLEAFAHDGFGVAHDARDQLGAGRDVVDQALHLAGRPDAVVVIPGAVDH